MKNLFAQAHKMTKEIKSQYPEVNYSFQFSLCLKYLQTAKEEVKIVGLQGSEKQVAWANDIRNSKISFLKTTTGFDLKMMGYTNEQLELTIKNYFNITSAQEIINKRFEKTSLIDIYGSVI